MDRNYTPLPKSSGFERSLSARRAWIEITVGGAPLEAVKVALRKESVDRNKSAKGLIATNAGRSPQGERG